MFPIRAGDIAGVIPRHKKYNDDLNNDNLQWGESQFIISTPCKLSRSVVNDYDKYSAIINHKIVLIVSKLNV